MRILIGFVAVALTAALVAAAVPPGDTLKPAGKVKIEGERDYPAYELVRLKAVGIEPKASLRWRVSPGEAIARATTAPEILEFVAPPGSYEVEVVVVTERPGGAEFDEAHTTVRISPYHPRWLKDKDAAKDAPKDKGM